MVAVFIAGLRDEGADPGFYVDGVVEVCVVDDCLERGLGRVREGLWRRRVGGGKGGSYVYVVNPDVCDARVFEVLPQTPYSNAIPITTKDVADLDII